MLRTLRAPAWLRSHSDEPSQRNQTGDDCGCPLPLTVVSQAMVSDCRRPSGSPWWSTSVMGPPSIALT